MSTRDLTKETFEQTITENDNVIVDFWAEWCGPCVSFAPIYETVSSKHPEIVFAKVDTEDQQELSAALNVMAMPTLMIFRDGIQIFSQPGAMPEHALEDLIDQAMKLDMDEVRTKVEEAESEHVHGPDCNHDHAEEE